MKIRIEDNSVRLRLRKSEVTALSEGGVLCGSTEFPEHTFKYCLKASPSVSDLQASFSKGTITVLLPESWARGWAAAPTVGFETQQDLDGATLHLLIEKDFVCLDRDPETQKDQFAHPKQRKS